MPRSSSLTVVVPRLLERIQPAPAASGVADSLLALVAGRGDVAHRWRALEPDHARLQPWQRGLLAVLKLDERLHPSAAMFALGQGLGSNHWMHADPIHLAAGLNEVTLVPLQPTFEWSTQESEAMTEAIRTHVESEGLELHRCSSRGWLLGAGERFDVSTVEPTFAARNEWSTVLPQGASAGRVRRLMTELQMLLHEHPVNQARAARGLPVVNALWLWGNGIARRAASQREMTCIGTSDYLRGVCAANGWKRPVGAPSVDALLSASHRVEAAVCVLDDISPSAFEQNWLSLLLEALRADRIARLDLVLDEWLVTIDRWRWRRFWRRPLPLQQWAAA